MLSISSNHILEGVHMDGNELVIFEMISHVGGARSSLMEALRFARQGSFTEAENKIKEASDLLSSGHKVHGQLVQKEASGEKVELSLLMVHAEDLMMTTEILKELVQEMLHMYREFGAHKAN